MLLNIVSFVTMSAFAISFGMKTGNNFSYEKVTITVEHVLKVLVYDLERSLDVRCFQTIN